MRSRWEARCRNCDPGRQHGEPRKTKLAFANPFIGTIDTQDASQQRSKQRRRSAMRTYKPLAACRK